MELYLVLFLSEGWADLYKHIVGESAYDAGWLDTERVHSRLSSTLHIE